MHYLKNMAFGDSCSDEDIGTINGWKVDAIAREYDCDVQLFSSPSTLRSLGLFPEHFFVPQWISGKVELDHEAIHVGRSSSRRRDIRKLADSKFSFVVTTKNDDLMNFYQQMYLPTIESSHGLAAIPMPIDDMLSRAENGTAELVLISDKHQPVAGSLIVYDQGTPRFLSMGVLNADDCHFRSGAGSAIYLFSFRHLLERGFDSVDIGRTRPFLNDGTLYYKKRLGLELTHASENGFYLKTHRNTCGVKDFLCSNPFVYAEKRELRGVVFATTDSANEEVAGGYNIPGLARFSVVDISTNLPVTRRCV